MAIMKSAVPDRRWLAAAWARPRFDQRTELDAACSAFVWWRFAVTGSRARVSGIPDGAPSLPGIGSPHARAHGERFEVPPMQRPVGQRSR
jgi:hypothetical protein